jgi:hypothetical protein
MDHNPEATGSKPVTGIFLFLQLSVKSLHSLIHSYLLYFVTFYLKKNEFYNK